jgi:subtilisin family serine protease
MEQAGKPPSEHGIHIAGLILGGPDYLLSDISSGSRPPIRLVPIVIEAPDKKISSSTVVDALGYARTRRARIINLSLEAKGAFESFQHIRAVGEVDQRLYVVAAGNGAFRVKDMVATNYWRLTDEDKRYWIVPAMLGGSYGENVISVAALGANDQRMGFSGFGSKHVDILAPGQCIDSFSKLEMKLSDSTRVGMSGTSQAAAITSFAASLLAAVIGPDFSPQRIKARLLGSAVLLPGVEDDILSRGKLSIERAVSIHEDIIHGMSDDETQPRDHFGILVDHMGRDKPPRSLWLCTTRAATVGTVDKVVIKNTEPKKMTASIVSNLEAWQWADCPFHEGNFSKIWLKTSEGTKSFQIANVKEIVPKMSRLTK